MADEQARKRGVRKGIRGTVVSRSGDKSIVVRVETRKRHSLYGKVLRRSRKFHAHDAENAARVGDAVRIEECRQMSRMKRWRLVEVVGAAPVEAGSGGES